MKRKLVSMTLALMMGISLTACGSGGDDKPATDGGNTATEDQVDGTGARMKDQAILVQQTTAAQQTAVQK